MPSSSCPGLVSENLTGTRGCVSKLSHVAARRRLQFLTRGPLHGAAHNRASPRVIRERVTKIGAAVFYRLIPGVTHFCHILSATQTEPGTTLGVRGQDKCVSTRRQGSMGAWLEAGYHIFCQCSSMGAAPPYVVGQFLVGWDGPRHGWTSNIPDLHPVNASSTS